MSRSLGLGLVIVLVAMGPPRAWGQDARVDASARIGAIDWFEDAKLGLFFHWGVYALLGRGEQVMEADRIPVSEYEKLPPHFHPTKFDAESWVRLARTAGARYITVTAKDHDGFCMFDSKLTRFDLVDATPYARDPLKDLAAACRQNRIKLFFSYSLLDWHHPDYWPAGQTGHAAGRPERGDWKQYVAYYQGQIRELCTNYGEIGGFWLDGWWDRPAADWDLEGTYRLIHKLQPAALVGNNHRGKPFPGEDFQIFEQDLPGQNTAGFNKAEVVADMPRETCLTINGSRGYNASDKNFKTAEHLIHALIGAAGRGANLLLNVGPKPDGTIGREFAERLEALGHWLDGQGDAIYGTRAGPIAPQPWGVSVRNKREVLLHVIRPEGPVKLPGFEPEIDARLFRSGKPVKVEPDQGGPVLVLPKSSRMPIDTIITIRAG